MNARTSRLLRRACRLLAQPEREVKRRWLRAAAPARAQMRRVFEAMLAEAK